MIELAQIYPYFNEDAETNWEEGNLNSKMSDDMMKLVVHKIVPVQEIGSYKVHDMTRCFKKKIGTSLPLVECPQHTTAKEM